MPTFKWPTRSELRGSGCGRVGPERSAGPCLHVGLARAMTCRGCRRQGSNFWRISFAHSALCLSTSLQRQKPLIFVRTKLLLPPCVVCRVYRKRSCHCIGSVCVSAARSLKRRGRTSRSLLGELLTLMATFRGAHANSKLGENSRRTLP